MSKGSGRRPAAIPRVQWDANWSRAFADWDAATGRVSERKIDCRACEGTGFVHEDGADYCPECNGNGWTWGEL